MTQHETSHQAGSHEVTKDELPDGSGKAASPLLTRKDIVNREKDEFGGIKIGSAFFGWLTATGTSVILIALLAAGGTAFAVATDTSASEAGDAAGKATDTVGLAGGIALLAVLFISYYCGGYVAGRMARFQGLRQGVATWLWGIVIAVAAAALTAIAGTEYNIFQQLNLPRLPVDEGDATTAGIIALVAAALAGLIGAMLGGLAGMRFHRKVDKAGLSDVTIR